MAPGNHRRGYVDAESLQPAAQRFISAQRYHAEALIIALQINGGRTVTNDPSS